MVDNQVKNTVNILDIGLLVLAYNRPEMLRRRIEELLHVDVCNLYISIDGGANSHTAEMEDTKNFAKLVLKKTKNFNLKHHKDNLGMVKHVTQEISNVLVSHKYIIVIEDDVVLTSNFIANMIHGFNLQNQMGLNGIISGWSPLHSNELSNKWRVTMYPFLWGWGCSNKVWEGYNYDLTKTEIEKQLEESNIWSTFSSYQKSKWLQIFKKAQHDPQWTWDAQLFFLLLRKNCENMSPIFSITGNEGFEDVRATHTKDAKPRSINNKKLNNTLFFRLTKFSKLIQIADKIFLADLKLVNKLIKFIKS